MHCFKRILVVCPADSVLQDLMDRVKSLTASGAAVTLATVVGSAPGEIERMMSRIVGAPDSTVEQRVLDARRAHLERWATPLRDAGIPVNTLADHGRAVLQLVRHVVRDGHGLLIKAAGREEGWPFLHGLDRALLRLRPCPVWILNGPQGDVGSRARHCQRRWLQGALTWS